MSLCFMANASSSQSACDPNCCALSTNLLSHEEDCATESSCWARNANPRLPVKMIECRKKSWIRLLLRWLRGRKKGREFARYQIGYYMGLQQKHTLGFTTRGKSREEEREVLVFMASKGARR